jgi:transcriptional regulator with XRE-family HTH domain
MDQNRLSLGAFLRAHRERLAPPSRGQRRRTPGLRREEIAAAADVSTTWYTWLEQGREMSPSPAALARLADAMSLNPAERAYLFDLANRRDPAAPPAIEGPITQLLKLPQQMGIPAYVMDRTWTALAWNDGAKRLFVGWLDEDHDRNLLRFIFLSPGARRLIGDWEGRSRRAVAEFRADFSVALRDPAMIASVDDLAHRSGDFRRLWEDQAVVGREGGQRLFNHPADGQIAYLQTTLLASWDTGLKLVTLAPEG